MSDPQTLVIQVEPDAPEGSEDAKACPPHLFEASWATPLDGGTENVPCIYCAACGEIRPLRIPSDRIPEE